MTLLSAAIDQTRQKLGRRDTLNKVNGALTTVEDTIVVDYDISGIAAGNRVSVDMQDFHVWAKVDATKTLTVESIAGVDILHADNSLLRANPTYSPLDIGQALNDELASLPGEGLFAWTVVNLTSNASKSGYNLTSVGDLLGVHKVRWEKPGSTDGWVSVDRKLWSVEQLMSTDDFAAAEALFVRAPIPSGVRLQVLYKKPFTALNLTTAGLAESVETVSGCLASHVPLVVVGAAIRLQLGLSSARADLSAQGDTRRPEEVSTSDARLSASPLQIERREMLKRAKIDQARRYGP